MPLIRCRHETCQATFPNRSELHRHKNREHRQYGGAELQDLPWAAGEDVFVELPNGENIRDTYENNDQTILAPHFNVGGLRSMYNFPINRLVTDQDIENQMNTIYREQNHNYKINIAAGVILQDRKTNKTRYFKPASNAVLMIQPIHIWNMYSLERAIRRLIELNLNELIRLYRPDSGYDVCFITQLEYYVYAGALPLGEDRELPEYIKNNKYILSRTKFNDGTPLDENLCFFTALAQSECTNRREYGYRSLDYRITYLFDKWQNYAKDKIANFKTENRSKYRGLQFQHIPFAEECFEVNINILQINADNTCHSTYVSIKKNEKTIHLNLFGNHLNLILDVDKYAARFICLVCERAFSRRGNLIRHSTTCASRVKHCFPGGYYKYHKSLFDRLSEVGINVPKQNRFYEAFAVWDLEAILQPINETSATNKLKFTHRHKAVGFSVASNVEGFEMPKNVIEEDPQELVNQMFDYIENIRKVAVTKSYQKLGYVVDALNAKMDERRAQVLSEMEQSNEAENVLDENELDDDADLDMLDDDVGEVGGGESEQDPLATDPVYKELNNLKSAMWSYMHQFILISFNGSKYDEHLIKSFLGNYFMFNENVEDKASLEMNENGLNVEVKTMGQSDMIKRSNSYVCISNNFYRMLDLCNYLPPATSYSDFLKAYDIEEEKFYFPYEYLTDYDCLKQDHLPPYPSAAWYSSLKQSDLLQSEYDNWLSGDKISPQPPTGLEKYKIIQDRWISEGWENMGDYLKYYNGCDTGPMVKGVNKLMSSYFDQNVDIWKECLSTPGVSRILLMRDAQSQNIIFPIFDERDKDLHYLMRSQICAGPSIVFTRKLERGITPLAPDSSELCENILGYDCASLYLGQMLHPMPSQTYVRRFKEENFRPQFRRRYILMYLWLETQSRLDNVHIRTRQNQGYECKVGKYFVDGLAVTGEQLTIYEFHGCRWHGHPCYLNNQSEQISSSLYNKTKEREAFFKKCNYKYVACWECEMINTLADGDDLRSRYNNLLPSFYKNYRNCVTEEQLLRGVKTGALFGFLVVDIHTPDELKKKFEKFPPIFSNSDITPDVVGEHMKLFMEEHGIKLKKRRLLVSGYAAKDILLSTPILQWYLQQGLVVTKISQVIEFVSSKPFESFVNDITHHRQMADKYPARKIIALNKKITGNSAYGSLILDKQKYTKTRNIKGDVNAKIAINERNFKSLSHIGDELYQVDTVPSKIKMDLPSYLGVWILLHAKLRMLQFVMDFLYKFLVYDYWVIGQMDTDSIYYSISKRLLIDVVKTEHKTMFQNMLTSCCTELGPQQRQERFIPRECCDHHRWLDSRTPNIFKLEWTGDRLIALNSKTYAGIDNHGNVKLSCKGVNARLVKQNKPMELYESVLSTGDSRSGINRGMRVDDLGVKSYAQSRAAFSYLYLKRKLEENGIHSTPLTITLDPVPIRYFCIQEHAKVLAADYQMRFRCFGRSFKSIRQAYSYMALINVQSTENENENDVCATIDPKDLMMLTKKVRSSQRWCAIRYEILKQIVQTRNEQIQNLRALLTSSIGQSIVNGCDIDVWLGVKYNARVLRWISDGELTGQNRLGQVYMEIRDELFSN